MRRYSFEDLLAQTAARGTGPGLEIVGFQSIRGFPVVTDELFGFDAQDNEEAIDYPALLPLFRDGGFTGYMSSEWEGHMHSDADAFKMIESHQAMCRRIWARHPATSDLGHWRSRHSAGTVVP